MYTRRSLLRDIQREQRVPHFADAAQLNSEFVERQVKLFDVGTEIKVKLAYGKKLEGLIADIGTQSFDLMSRKGHVLRRIDYQDAARLETRALKYRASANKRVNEARSVAAGLGTRKLVRVKVTSGRTLTGNIQRVNDDQVEFSPKGQTGSFPIAYSDVLELGPKDSSRAQTIFIVSFVVLFQAH